MSSAFVPLYCEQCHKEFKVREADVERVRKHSPESLLPRGEGLRFEGGCFFKTAAALRREKAALGSGSSETNGGA